MAHINKWFARLMCVAVLAGGFTLPQAGAVQTVEVNLYPLVIELDGVKVLSYNADGRDVPALFYCGSNYFPVRTAGEWMGKEVSWDGANAVISLENDVEPVMHPLIGVDKNLETAYSYQYGEAVDAVLRDDMRILLDGEEQLFKSQSGARVYPLLYRGTTYLPIRNIGELLGMEIAWRNPSKDQAPQVSLYTPMTGDQKTLCTEYLNAVSVLSKKHDGALVSLYNNNEDKAKLKINLDAAKSALDEMKAVRIPNVPYLQSATEPLLRAIDEELAKIEAAYPLLETQTFEELYAVEHGQTTGVIIDLATSPYVSICLDNLKEGLEREGLLT